MIENEGQELENESDESEQASSEPASSEGQSQDPAVKAESSDTQPDSDDNKPFHQHPRWIERDNELKAEREARKTLEERYQKLEAQLNTLSKPAQEEKKDELIEDLKKIDPRLASRLEAYNKALPTIEGMQKQFQEYQQNQWRQQAIAQVNTLHESNKVSPELKGFINNELERLYTSGQLKDVQTSYNAIYGQFKKFIDGIERSTKASYVTDKTKDAKIPTSQPKGKPVSQAPKKMEFSKDPEVARNQIVSRYLKQAKAEADI